jgi:predicted glycoside hydrolase/deacetylase ChbG (UPF0249 family)
VPGGVTEVGCHPGYPEDLSSMYRHERAAELAALCSAEVRRVFVETDVRLLSFFDLIGRRPHAESAPTAAEPG